MTEVHEVLLAGILEAHGDSSKWEGAKFEKIKRISNTKVGVVGQEFIEKLSLTLGISCSLPMSPGGLPMKQSPWDLNLNGIKFELKTATEDVSGSYQFNHIRYHRQYDALLVLGISPNDIRFHMWTKGDLATGKAGSLVSMEKNANASYKLTKRPRDLYPIDLFLEIFDKFEGEWAG